MAAEAEQSDGVAVLAATQQHARPNHVHRRRRGGARRAARLAGGLARRAGAVDAGRRAASARRLSAFFSSVFAFAATADDNGDGVPDFFGCNNISVAADTLLPAVVVGSVSGAAAARLPTHRAGWARIRRARSPASSPAAPRSQRCMLRITRRRFSGRRRRRRRRSRRRWSVRSASPKAPPPSGADTAPASPPPRGACPARAPSAARPAVCATLSFRRPTCWTTISM